MDINGWDAAVVIAKAITYAATLGAAGGLFFLAYCRDLVHAVPLSRIRRLIGSLLIVSAIASGVRILLLAGSMSGDLAGMFDSTLVGMIWRAGEGRATGIRIVGLALAAVAMIATRENAVNTNRENTAGTVTAHSATAERTASTASPSLTASTSLRRAFLSAASVTGAAIASISFAWVGHAHAAPANLLPTLLLCAHLLCAAFWLGALAPLLAVARHGRSAEVAMAAARFGKLALAVVAVLLAAGLSLLGALLGNLSDLWTSGYGRMVLIKVGLVACLLSFAALNKLYLTPKLVNGEPAATSSLRRSIKIEILLGSLILLVTAAFTTLTGPPH